MSFLYFLAGAMSSGRGEQGVTKQINSGAGVSRGQGQPPVVQRPTTAVSQGGAQRAGRPIISGEALRRAAAKKA